jgi:hypothetical protein
MHGGNVMDINLNRIFNANQLGAADFDQLQDADAVKSIQQDAGGIYGPSLVVTDSQPNMAVEAFEDEDYAPVRDDDLGKMVKSAFDLTPPDVPNFI